MEMVPTRPPIIRQASPARAISRLCTSPMSNGMTVGDDVELA
jgi:hypothetical protein